MLSFHLRSCCIQNADLAKLKNIENQLYVITQSPDPCGCHFALYFPIYSTLRTPPLVVSNADQDPVSLVVLRNIQQISELLLLTGGEMVVFFSKAVKRELRYHSN